MIVLEEMLYGYSIRTEAHRLDQGVHVLITGGCRTHVGAVSAAMPGEPPETMAFPGHKDHLISEPWAAALARRLGERAVVACGIHYHAATAEQIAEILRVTGRMLQEILDQM